MAWGQAYPVKPVKLVVPFPAGGPADLFARTLAAGMSAELREQIVVENRSGAGGLTGVDTVAKSAPDGYTLGLAGAAALATIPFMVHTMPFDWERDLALLTLVARVPEVLSVTSKLDAASMPAFVAHAKANPGKVNFGSAGVGSITHLAAELFKAEAKLDLVHVPYRGAAPAVNDLLGGHVQMLIADVPVLLAHIRSGAIKALAVTSGSRTNILPDVPTTTEVGYPKVLSDNWYALVAPAGLAPAVVAKVREAALKALTARELVQKFESQAAVPAPCTPDEFAAFVRAERAKWGPLVKAAGVKLEQQ
jgi:tripartite-type tricarboxylate transporter receptor subunit TctC